MKLLPVRKLIVLTLEWLCGVLDNVPFPERDDDGRWEFYKGSLGCYRLRLAERSMKLDDRWHTGVWIAPVNRPRAEH